MKDACDVANRVERDDAEYRTEDPAEPPTFASTNSISAVVSPAESSSLSLTLTDRHATMTVPRVGWTRMPGPGDSTSREYRLTVPDVVVIAEDRSEVINPDLAAEIGIGGVLAERKLAFGATPPAFDVGLGAIERHALERGRDDILADGAGGA